MSNAANSHHLAGTLSRRRNAKSQLLQPFWQLAAARRVVENTNTCNKALFLRIPPSPSTKHIPSLCDSITNSTEYTLNYRLNLLTLFRHLHNSDKVKEEGVHSWRLNKSRSVECCKAVKVREATTAHLLYSMRKQTLYARSQIINADKIRHNNGQRGKSKCARKCASILIVNEETWAV